jgi:hypothetical protein
MNCSRQRLTSRLVDEVICLGRARLTPSEIAAQLGPSRRTISNLLALDARAQLTPQEVCRQATSTEDAACVIQIDDAHPSAGPMTTILCNGQPLELLRKYNKASIADFYFTLEGRSRVKVYVADFAPYLLTLGRQFFPGAYIVGDPYHLIQRYLIRFDRLLEPLEPQLLAAYASAVRDDRYLRPKRTKRETERQDAQSSKGSKAPNIAELRMLLHSRLRELTRPQKHFISSLVRQFGAIQPAYVYLQGLLALYRRNMSPEEASLALDRLGSRLPEGVRIHFAAFLSMARKRRDAICAYWACGWTNGETEAQNNVIKIIDRAGRGLSHAELRRRWLYGKSATARLQKPQSSHSKPPVKKEIRLGTLPPPEPVPVVGKGDQLWLFDL